MAFIGLPLVLVLLVVGVVYAVQHRPAHVTGGGLAAQHEVRHVGPSSRVGMWSLWVLVAAIVMQAALSAVVTWGGAPLGAVAFVLAVIAMTRYHDRSPLLMLSLLVGLFAAGFPFAFWLLS